MASCRRGCQTSLVALALYPRECQSRTVVRARRDVKPPARPGADQDASQASTLVRLGRWSDQDAGYREGRIGADVQR
jgi:hypothetical protein